MTFTIKLQSPKWDNNTNGEEIKLPTARYSYGGNSLAVMLPLLKGKTATLDLGQVRQVVRMGGFLTQQAATEAGYANPTHFRDILTRTRLNWPTEDGTVTGANWGTASLPSDEQESGQARKRGRCRLILDKKWDTGSASLKPFIMYGSIGDYQFPEVQASSGRTKIPWTITFLVGEVVL